jgi:hypothetical protein
MMDFKVGDNVECVRPCGFAGYARQHNVGDILVITSISDGGRYLRFNDLESGWAIDCFKLVEEKPSIDYLEITKGVIGG